MTIRCNYCEKEDANFNTQSDVYSCNCCGKVFSIEKDGNVKTIKRPFPYIWLALIALVVFFINAFVLKGLIVVSIIAVWIMFVLCLLLALHHKIIFSRPTIYLNLPNLSFSDKFITVFVFLLYFVPTVTIPYFIVKKLLNT